MSQTEAKVCIGAPARYRWMNWAQPPPSHHLQPRRTLKGAMFPINFLVEIRATDGDFKADRWANKKETYF